MLTLGIPALEIVSQPGPPSYDLREPSGRYWRKMGAPESHLLPCVQSSLYRARKDLRNIIHQDSGSKQTALSKRVI